MFLDVATRQQSAALFIAANSRHYWAQVVGQNLTVAYKGSGHAISKNYCNFGVGRSDRLFNICI
jgi:hypothetical protein